MIRMEWGGAGPDDGRRAPDGFRGAARRIEGEGPWRDAAEALGCELAAIKAVAEVESRGAPFLASGRPPILFERHVFHRLTGGEFDGVPTVSDPVPGGYGRGGEAQYARLETAATLHREAALKATSWGRFQVLGRNAELCGWPDVESFVADMCEDEASQLAAFAGYVRGARLERALRERDWAAFARGYNGPAYAKNRYDEKMAAAYARHAGASVEDGRFRVAGLADLQKALAHLGADPGPADGLMGPRTCAAILRFERRVALPETGEPSAAVRIAAQAAVHALGEGPALAA
ncbi:MAG: N-acetylmuramidase domain-containing protein [Pseudomonadota bacterium]